MNSKHALAPIEFEPDPSNWLRTSPEDNLHYQVSRPLFFSLPKTIESLNWDWLFVASLSQVVSPMHGSIVIEHGIVEACEKVKGLQQLRQNWAGARTVSPSATVVRNAMSALTMAPDTYFVPDVIPNPNGTISFLWEAKEGTAHLEIGEAEFSFYAEAINGLEANEYGSLENFPGGIAGSIQAIAGPPPFAELSFTISAIENK